MDRNDSYAIAKAVVARILRQLPAQLRARAESVPVVYADRPGRELLAAGFEDDLMGLFDGEAFPDGESGHALPPRIVLFLENIREDASDDEDRFREEVRTTYLHELGHYLGLDEDALADRGLE